MYAAANAAHFPTQNTVPLPMGSRSACSHCEPHEGCVEERVCELLEQLDDAVFAAITGDMTALEMAQMLWPQTLVELGWEAVAESRQQYLRFAAEVAEKPDPACAQSNHRALAARKVISLLTRF